jgi:hypothetical protein
MLGPEIHQNGQLGVEHLGFEVCFVKLNGHAEREVGTCEVSSNSAASSTNLSTSMGDDSCLSTRSIGGRFRESSGDLSKKKDLNPMV